MFNSSAAVIVAVREMYNDNDGAFEVAYHWDGETVETSRQCGSADFLSVNATEEQIQAAGDWYKAHSGDTNKDTYIGCTVMLKGSRKAPNAKPLQVVDYANRFLS